MRLILTYVTIIILFSACETVTTKNSSGNHLTASEERGIEPVLVSSSTPANQSLMALVIGNTEYEFAPLANPINDATDIAKVLRKIGFNVILKTDLDQVAMGTAIRQFTARLSKQSVGLFYFAGHGTQVDGRNYLLPIDNSKIGDKQDLAAYAIDVNLHVLSRMEENNSHLNVVILDACRDNPYRSVSRGADRGLALIQSRLGSIIAFATSPGKTAADVSAGQRNGLYTKYLLKGLKRAHKTHQRIDDMLMQVGNGVTQESRRDQEPWYNASLRAPFCFGGCQLAQVTPPIPTTPKQIPLTSAKPSSATVTSSAQSKAQDWFDKGKSLYKSGRYQEAIESFDKALAIQSDFHDAWYNRGNALEELGRYEAAIESYDKILAIKPDDHDAWYNRGVALGKLGRYEAAIESYDKILAIKPDDHDAWYNRGVALGKLGRYEAAIKSYDKALAIKSDYWAWHNRGNALYKLGRYEAAEDSYDKALAIKPDDHYAWHGRGNVLGKLGRHQEAIKSYDKALAIKPDDHKAWNNRGFALGQLGRHQEAIKNYDKALAIKPDDHKAWNNRGFALGQLGRHQEAIKNYDKALAIKPDYHDAWYSRGIALGNLNRYQEAIKSYDKVLGIKPDYHDAWNSRGIALGKLDRYQEATKSYDKALAIKPDDPSAWYNRGIALGKLDRYQKAIESFDKALKLKPNEPNYLKGRDWALQLNNR